MQLVSIKAYITNDFPFCFQFFILSVLGKKYESFHLFLINPNFSNVALQLPVIRNKIINKKGIVLFQQFLFRIRLEEVLVISIKEH